MINPEIRLFNTIKLPTVIKIDCPPGKGEKATYMLTWDNLLLVKVFFPHLSHYKMLEKYNSHYPSEIDLVQQLLVMKQQHNVNFDLITMPL